MDNTTPNYAWRDFEQDALSHPVFPSSSLQVLIDWAERYSLRNQAFFHIVDNNFPMFAKIVSGKREGTIGRVDTSLIIQRQYQPHLLRDMTTLFEDNFVILTEPRFGLSKKTLGYMVTFKRYIEWDGHIVLKFDDRRPVKVKNPELFDTRVMPFYSGPTNYVAPAPTLRSSNLGNLPIDRFGQTINLNDLFLYAGDELVIGQLVSTNEKGIVTYKDVMSAKTHRILTETTKQNVRMNLSDCKFLRFEKDEVLSRSIMINKLTK